MTNGFALNHGKSLQIYFFCVKRQAKNDFLKDVESTAGAIFHYHLSIYKTFLDNKMSIFEEYGASFSAVLFLFFHGIIDPSPYTDITKSRLFEYIENSTTKKRKIFELKKSDIFLHRLWVLVRTAVLTSTHNLCFLAK